MVLPFFVSLKSMHLPAILDASSPRGRWRAGCCSCADRAGLGQRPSFGPLRLQIPLQSGHAVVSAPGARHSAVHCRHPLHVCEFLSLFQAWERQVVPWDTFHQL